MIASGVIGRDPTPDQVLSRLEQTAAAAGRLEAKPDYGYGLLDAGAATSPRSASAGAGS